MAGMADHAMSGPMDENMMKHMELTPVRAATHGDTVRAMHWPAELKQAIAKYADTAAAVADGYKMFLPNVKQQKVYHFTNYGRAFMEAFRFDPAKPTSILYSRGARRQAQARRRDVHDAEEREPRPAERPGPARRRAMAQARELVSAEEGSESRYLEPERTPVFGPESPIATKAECDAVDGDFHRICSAG